MYGNRGCLHDDRGHIKRRYNGKRWIACRLEFRGWQRGALLRPGRFTELFFLDEATAFAAGHRPCALCRREDYNRFAEIWSGLHPGQHRADAMDERLHRERVDPQTRGQLRHESAPDALPDGAFVLLEGRPWLVRGSSLHGWTPGGYDTRMPRPARGAVVLLTPPTLVAVLHVGWSGAVPLVHPSAGRPA